VANIGERPVLRLDLVGARRWLRAAALVLAASLWVQACDVPPPARPPEPLAGKSAPITVEKLQGPVALAPAMTAKPPQATAQPAAPAQPAALSVPVPPPPPAAAAAQPPAPPTPAPTAAAAPAPKPPSAIAATAPPPPVPPAPAALPAPPPPIAAAATPSPAPASAPAPPPPGAVCPPGTIGIWSKDVIESAVYICRPLRPTQ
jgi:hypothetical protein